MKIIFTLFDVEKIKIFIKSYAKSNYRFKLFNAKGYKCVACNKEANALILSSHKDDSLHFDLYHLTETEKVLFTVDHIIPKSLGGSRSNLANLQPMCYPCNQAKGNKRPEIEYYI